MDSIVRRIENSLHHAGRKDLDHVSARRARQSPIITPQPNTIHNTTGAAQLRATFAAAPPTFARSIDGTTTSSSSSSSSSSSKARSSASSSRATSTTSKKPTRDFMSSFNAYPWITGTTPASSTRTSPSSAAVASLRRTAKNRNHNPGGEKKRAVDASSFTFPCLTGCV